MRRRLSLGLTLAVTLLAAAPPLASAESTVSGGSDPASGTIDASVHRYVGRWSGRHSSCHWSPFFGDTALDNIQATGPVRKQVAGVEYRLLLQRCPGTADALVWVGPGNARRLVGDSWDALVARLPKPILSTAPPLDSLYVTLDTWLWTASDWTPASITAWVPTETDATVWATTTAVPVRLVIDPGDGSAPIVCDGPGTPWTAEAGDEAASDCSHVFRHSSLTAPDGRAFVGSVAIDWEIDWTSSTGEGGPLAPATTRTTARFEVGEIQAVIDH